MSPCYASDLEALTGRSRLWIHGHVHESLDYGVRGTRVLSNPRGYKLLGQGMENQAFQADRVVEL